VRRRVAAGGHGIPEETIRRRFGRSLEYLGTRYKPIVDEWYVWDSLEGEFRLAEAWDD
jgi:predicted ABC-type ATPase